MPLSFVPSGRTAFFTSLPLTCLAAVLTFTPGGVCRAQNNQPAATNLLVEANDFDKGTMTDNPWGGVKDGVLTVLPGEQRAVNDNGQVVWSNPGPSVAIGDMKGQGLQDIIVADPRGFFWYFPNTGKNNAPKFTCGEIMPIWIGNPQPLPFVIGEGDSNTVPRICVVDFDKSGKLGIVAGNYEGKLYYIGNSGTSRNPNFRMPQDPSRLVVPTYSEGKLWCNFLAPCVYDWKGNNIMDLIMGEGTYASNSIYLLWNKGSNDSPTFNEANTIKIIPGLGREHLTPQVVDWNNDGKPDIISGERTGAINVFLNTSTDEDHPTFDQGQHVKFGGKEVVGPFTTVAVADLTQDKLPNLLMSTSSNQVLYATNTGTPGSPLFGAPLPVHGTNPLPKILPASGGWEVTKALGIPYINLVCTNATIEPDFKGPTDDIHSALKYYTEPHPFNTDFPNTFYPAEDTQIIEYAPRSNPKDLHSWAKPACALKWDTQYTITFWVKVDGDISNFIFWLRGEEDAPKNVRHPIGIGSEPISASSGWTQVTDTFSFPLYDDVKPAPASGTFALNLGFAFNGHPTIYLAGFNLTENK